MILISSTEVERKIAQNTFISWEKTKYLIFTVALYCISGPTYSITPSFGDNRTVFDTLITPIVYILITYFGIKKCYETNRNLDDADFIERFTILNVPMTIKLMLIFLPATLLIAFLPYLITKDKELRTHITYSSLKIAGAIGMIIYYMFLNRSFKRLGVLLKEMRKS